MILVLCNSIFLEVAMISKLVIPLFKKLKIVFIHLAWILFGIAALTNLHLLIHSRWNSPLFSVWHKWSWVFSWKVGMLCTLSPNSTFSLSFCLNFVSWSSCLATWSSWFLSSGSLFQTIQQSNHQILHLASSIWWSICFSKWVALMVNLSMTRIPKNKFRNYF